MTGTPAFVHNGRPDILYANQLGYALFSEIFRDPVRPANLARFFFLDHEITNEMESSPATGIEALGLVPVSCP